MEYEDTVRLATPEGIELELPLAGIGSRLAARCIDHLIQAAGAILAIIIYANAVEGSTMAEALAAILGVLMVFAIFWVYDVAFEAFNGGRTPGKRALGLRVVGERGEPISLPAASLRNVLRIVDEYLTLWLAALISMLRSERNQRLGDIAAGAMVVKERTAEAQAEAAIGLSALPELAVAGAWDTTAITEADLAAARRFLERRSALEPGARAHLAGEIYARLQPKVSGAGQVNSAEKFLELLVAIKSSRGF